MDDKSRYIQAAKGIAQAGWVISYAELRAWFEREQDKQGGGAGLALSRMEWLAGPGLDLFAFAPALPLVPARVAFDGKQGRALDLCRVRSKSLAGEVHEVLVLPGCGEAALCGCRAWEVWGGCEHGALAELADLWWSAAQVLMQRGYTASRLARVWSNTLRQERTHRHPRVQAARRMIRCAGLPLPSDGCPAPRALLQVEVQDLPVGIA